MIARWLASLPSSWYFWTPPACAMTVRTMRLVCSGFRVDVRLTQVRGCWGGVCRYTGRMAPGFVMVPGRCVGRRSPTLRWLLRGVDDNAPRGPALAFVRTRARRRRSLRHGREPTRTISGGPHSVPRSIVARMPPSSLRSYACHRAGRRAEVPYGRSSGPPNRVGCVTCIRIVLGGKHEAGLPPGGDEAGRRFMPTVRDKRPSPGKARLQRWLPPVIQHPIHPDSLARAGQSECQLGTPVMAIKITARQ